jgi:hypothetical protein
LVRGERLPTHVAAALRNWIHEIKHVADRIARQAADIRTRRNNLMLLRNETDPNLGSSEYFKHQ